MRESSAPGRETVAPFGDVVQCFASAAGSASNTLNLRADRPRIGKRQADLKTETRGGLVQRKNLQRIVLLGDDNTEISFALALAGAASFESGAHWSRRLMRSIRRRGSHRPRTGAGSLKKR